MLKSFLQTLVVTSIITLISFSPVIGMEYGEDGEDGYKASGVYAQPAENGIIEDLEEQRPLVERPEETDKNCSHWGLSHWFSGIGEYLERCLCCENAIDENRAHITKQTHRLRGREEERIVGTSDCFCLYPNVDYDTCRDPAECDGWCDNPIGGTLCCPFVALGHLCCLPCALCCCSKNQNITYRAPWRGVTTPFSPPLPTEEEVAAAQRKAERNRIQTNDSPETRRLKGLQMK